MSNSKKPIHVIGGGLAGSEAAWQISKQHVPVILHEMRPILKTAAHQTNCLAELVCSNSFRSDDHDYNAVGILHREMRNLGSIIMECADQHRVPAGSALAVDRDAFSQSVQEKIEKEPLINIKRNELIEIPPDSWGRIIIATGPLTSASLSNSIIKLTGEDSLAFFDAIAPIIHKDSIDFNRAWFQSRYDKGDSSDYINCPMNQEEYTQFICSLIESEKNEFKDWEQNTPYFEGCLPIEVMASRGIETLRYGPMKPVGLTNPHSPGSRSWAIVQLRQDNALGTLYNMVGFQTKLKYGDQKNVLRLIPGLEKAEFARLGGIHRNTFINAPKLLDTKLRLKTKQNLWFAGQITGCEGYAESTAIGLLAGRFAAADANDTSFVPPPTTTSIGALLSHITGGAKTETYQPMNINFGLFPELQTNLDNISKKNRIKGRDKKKAYSTRAETDFINWQLQ